MTQWLLCVFSLVVQSLKQMVVSSLIVMTVMQSAYAIPNHTCSEYAKLSPHVDNFMVRSLSIVNQSVRPNTNMSPTTIVPNAYKDGNNATIAQIAQMADGSVQQATINAANGVAGLDGGGNVTSPLKADKSMWVQKSNGDVITSSQPVDYNDPTHWGIDPDGYQFGGALGADILGQGAPPGSRGTLGSNRINCHPYGNYDAGACLTVVNASRRREQARAPIGGGLESSVANISNYYGFENVVAELDSNSPDARMIIQGVSYDATHVYMSGCGPSSSTVCIPLTSAQMAQLRIGMSITTNSLYAGMPAYTPGSQSTLPQAGLYQAFVQNWDPSGKSITITPGWAVPRSGNGAVGQIPSSTLDTYWTNYNTPTVFLGAEHKDFIGHSVVYYNPTLDASGTPKSSLVHNLEWWEVDMVNQASADYMASFHGLTLSYSGAKKPTSDSYGLFIGGGFGTGGGSLLRITGKAGENEINANSLKMFASYPVPSASTSTVEIGEMQGQSDGNKLRLVNYLRRESDGGNGWKNTSYNLGVFVDGSQGNASIGQPLSGTQMARIAWNYGSNLGGLDFFTNNGLDVLTLSGSGNALINGTFVTSGQATFNGQILAASNAITRGTHYFQTADGKNQFALVSGDNGSITLNSLNNGKMIVNSGTAFNSTLQIPFGTPSSSTASCTRGQMEMDTNYIYTCVATNTWHRTSNGASW